jgi:hypothetical protein
MAAPARGRGGEGDRERFLLFRRGDLDLDLDLERDLDLDRERAYGRCLSRSRSEFSCWEWNRSNSASRRFCSSWARPSRNRTSNQESHQKNPGLSGLRTEKLLLGFFLFVLFVRVWSGWVVWVVHINYDNGVFQICLCNIGCYRCGLCCMGVCQ